ncbi:riboflavin synthase [Peptoniphilus indolicus]|uniref:Riboflavin synthase n=2 Tax=Peptoniphilus indolicus TaxID=33030 RepID=G4D4F3_9FIRM|nr:riboflavin synthase [Peptoniphilus indolicus]EGY79593.1 riboflavin synthase subunit alpha [Peptoniphilus indolicus ATCC 29427]SUB75966.1 Riboflavin synthase alpha chain [Peptoniphilus indolicus]
MFTGIVEEIGTLRKIEKRGDRLTIYVDSKLVLEDVKLGDSIATNGVCLTVTSFGADFFTADMMRVTAEKSALNSLVSGSKLNLERAVRPMDRLGGHILQGHVDTVGKVISKTPNKDGYLLEISVDDEFKTQFVAQGSIGLNGVSLTLANVSRNSFTVSLIPETLARTNLGNLDLGDGINVEFDVLGKYINRYFEFENESSKSKIDMEFLRKYGF